MALSERGAGNRSGNMQCVRSYSNYMTHLKMELLFLLRVISFNLHLYKKSLDYYK